MSTVSVIIPTYNHCNYILATLDSVFAQTYTDYEVIVVNDGSPDDTTERLRPLAKAGRIRYVEQDNAGQAAARNRGIEISRGEFVALLDDDDLWPPDKLEWQVALLKSTPDAALVYGVATKIGRDTTISEIDGEAEDIEHSCLPSGWVYKELLKRIWINSPGQTLIRSSSLSRIGGIDEAIWGADDYDLYIRLAIVGTFVYCKKLALYYRIHPGNATRDIDRMYVNNWAVRRKHLGAFPRISNRHEWFASYRYWQAKFSRLYMYAANDAWRNGDRPTAKRMYWRAVQLNPLWLCRRSFVGFVLKQLVASYLD